MPNTMNQSFALMRLSERDPKSTTPYFGHLPHSCYI